MGTVIVTSTIAYTILDKRYLYLAQQYAVMHVTAVLNSAHPTEYRIELNSIWGNMSYDGCPLIPPTCILYSLIASAKLLTIFSGSPTGFV